MVVIGHAAGGHQQPNARVLLGGGDLTREGDDPARGPAAGQPLEVDGVGIKTDLAA